MCSSIMINPQKKMGRATIKLCGIQPKKMGRATIKLCGIQPKNNSSNRSPPETVPFPSSADPAAISGGWIWLTPWIVHHENPTNSPLKSKLSPPKDHHEKSQVLMKSAYVLYVCCLMLNPICSALLEITGAIIFIPISPRVPSRIPLDPAPLEFLRRLDPVGRLLNCGCSSFMVEWWNHMGFFG